MSQLKLSGDASGTGIVTVAAPNTNSTYTVTLPAAAGTLARTDAAQTFTGTQTFSSGASIQGLTVGRGAGAVSTNTAVGASALSVNTTGSNVTAVGASALAANNAGYNIAAFGYLALSANTDGHSSAAFGDSALNANTTGSDNTAVGSRAAFFYTTGVYNTAVGRRALEGASGTSTGSYNTALGGQALFSNTTASNNTAVGYQALYNVLPATISVASGSGTLTNGVEYTITVLGTVNWTTIGAASPAAVGNKFTYNNATITGSGGSVTQNVNAKNVAIGYQAGDVITTGTGNVIIGGGADPSVNSATDQIVIGNGVTGQANTNVTIGNGAGKIYNAYTVNATWTQTSDGTMKNVIGPDSLGLSFINRLNPILFTWKAQNDLPPDHPYYAEENKRDTTRVIHGFVAQEVKAALDAEGCSTFNGWDQGDDGIQAISREMFISPLVKAVQELSAQVEQLKAELAALKGV